MLDLYSLVLVDLQWYGHVKRMQDERLPKLWSGYQGKEEKEDVQEKCGWKVYEQP
jgi:hypothetical protein